MTDGERTPRDRNGRYAVVGSQVRILRLSGQWLDRLPSDEMDDVLSMVGELHVVEEIDAYGQAWVRKSWSEPEEGRCRSHSVALEAHDMQVEDEQE
jgi:hypothetical protein